MTIQQHLVGSGMNPYLAIATVGGVISTEAGAGSSQTDATLLTLASVHWIKTAANNSGVVLPPGGSTKVDTMQAGDTMWVYNGDSNTLKVYPPGTGKINGGSASASISLTTLQKGLFICLDGGANANFLALVS
jgi:hypothetical protein